jgi:hypothetical protein
MEEIIKTLERAKILEIAERRSTESMRKRREEIGETLIHQKENTNN